MESSCTLCPLCFKNEGDLGSLKLMGSEPDREWFARDKGAGIGGANLFSELADGPAKNGVDPVPDDFGGRDQGEGALVQPGMGDLEVGSAPNEITRHEQVEIEDPRAPALLGAAVSSGRGLELVAGSEQGHGIGAPVHEDSGIAVVWLFRSDRPGTPQPRDGNDVSERCEGGDRG